MADERRPIDSTDLIDVGDIDQIFDEDISATQMDDSPPRLGGGMQEAERSGPMIASLRDRFVALLIDATFLYVLYWGLMLVYRVIAFGVAAGPIPAAGMSGLIFNGIFLLLALLWFVLPEFIFSASIGKLFCRLSIRSVDGSPPSFLSALIRNLLRPIDLLLFPILIVAAMMEWSSWHRRIGDLLGGTIVLRTLTRAPRQYALSLDIIASTCRRTLAFLVDLALFAAFAGGLALLLNPEEPLVSMLLLVLAPIALGLFFIMPEWFTKTSPGKWLFGLAVCHEDGTAVDLPGATVRTIWRIIDTNPFGFLTSLFGQRKQRPGDSAAGTVVVRVPREWRGLVGLAGIILISLAIASAGLQNRDSLLSSDFEVNFLPSIDIRGMQARKAPSGPAHLVIKNFSFAVGNPDSPRRPSIFQPGEMLYLVFDVNGFSREQTQVWLQEDLSIRYPDNSVGLKLENVNDFRKDLDQPGMIRFENNISLPKNAQTGRYTVTITIRDKLSRRELKEQRFFYITPQTATGAKADTLQGDSKDTSTTTEGDDREGSDIEEEDVEDSGPVSPFATPEELDE